MIPVTTMKQTVLMQLKNHRDHVETLITKLECAETVEEVAEALQYSKNLIKNETDPI